MNTERHICKALWHLRQGARAAAMDQSLSRRITNCLTGLRLDLEEKLGGEYVECHVCGEPATHRTQGGYAYCEEHGNGP